jgi:hypothetical protein
MRNAMQFLAAVALTVTAASALAQNAATLKVDDLVGVWNMTYESGEGGTFTITKNENGTAKIVVSTTQGGESEARDVAIAGDTISFARTINVQGQAGSVNYTAKLVDGKLQGSGLVNLGAADGAAPGGAPAAMPTPFTATRAP